MRDRTRGLLHHVEHMVSGLYAALGFQNAQKIHRAEFDDPLLVAYFDAAKESAGLQVVQLPNAIAVAAIFSIRTLAHRGYHIGCNEPRVQRTNGV